ncbi:MAG: hypothetical protein KAR31_10440 [Candidatus Omnitrophica bacterium]|nr:hypothetical protein [Candidatus Omnitrophota bacterium]
MNVDLDEYERNWRNKICKNGVVDKGYLKTSIFEIRDNLLNVFAKELETIGINTNVPKEKKLQEIPFPKNDVEEASFHGSCESDHVPGFIGKAEAAEILGISQSSLLVFAKRGLVQGELDPSIGWRFVRKHIKSILRQKPEFLKKIWKRSNGVARKNPVPKEEGRPEKIYIGLDYASEILSIEKQILIALVEKEEIPAEFNKDMGEWLFVRSDVDELLIEKPALLLKIKELGLKA